MTPRLELLAKEDELCASYALQIQNKIHHEIERYAEAVNAASSGENDQHHRKLAIRILGCLRHDLSGPPSGWAVLLDRNEETGEPSNPRVVESAPAEELFYPEDENGEPAEEAICAMSIRVPVMGWLPDIG